MALPPLKTYELPNGLKLSYPSNPYEIEGVYKENFEDKQYLQNGVTLRPGGTVVDVGAHAGVFALYAAQAVGPTGRVIAIEPSPLNQACCVANISAHAAWLEATQGARPAPIDAPLLACGDGSVDRLTLTMYENSATSNSCFPNPKEMLLASKTIIFTAIKEGKPIGNSADRALMRMASKLVNSRLTSAIATPVVSAVAGLAARRVLAGQSKVSCEVVTVSRLMRDMELSSVDLLKVDVERAELAVLRGVAQDDWPRIKQLVVEVHDAFLQEVVSLLKGSAGFGKVVVTEADPGEVGPGLWMVHATRT